MIFLIPWCLCCTINTNNIIMKVNYWSSGFIISVDSSLCNKYRRWGDNRLIDVTFEVKIRIANFWTSVRSFSVLLGMMDMNFFNIVLKQCIQSIARKKFQSNKSSAWSIFDYLLHTLKNCSILFFGLKFSEIWEKMNSFFFILFNN